MRQKFLFVWHVLIFNVIKPLPYSSYYFNNHFRSPTQSIADYSISRYTGIVNFGKEQSGYTGVILANIALMLFFLPLCFSVDWINHAVPLLSVKISVNVILVLMAMIKFDMLCLRDKRNYLKLFYVFSCLVTSSYWTLTCVFLTAFENMGL
jgi:hypothetical protein